MDVDAATLWTATRSAQAFRDAQNQGVTADLLKGGGKEAWTFIEEYFGKYAELPGPSLIVEHTGFPMHPPDEGDDVALGYLLEFLYDRAEFKALKYGLNKSVEFLEAGKQSETVEEVLKLSDHLRKRQAAKSKVYTLAEVAPEVLAQYEATKRGEIGIPFLWPAMTEITMGMWPKTLTFFVARPGSGKCVHEDTEIVDPVTGVPRTIRQIYGGDESSVASWSKDRAIHVAPITAKVDTGHKKCLRVGFRTGRSIVVTPEHPLLSPQDWVRTDEVRVGMTLALPAVMPMPEQPVALHPSEVDLLAILLAEGSYTGNHVGFTTTDPRILRLAEEAARWAGVPVKWRSKYDYDFAGDKGDPNPVRALLRKHGIDNTLAKNKVFPEAIWRLPPEQLATFLSVFWMCDGYVTGNEVGICLASERMVRQIQSLLLRFGVQSTVKYKSSKIGEKAYDAWRLTVHAACFEAFDRAIRLWGDKGQGLVRLLKLDRNPNVGFPRVDDAMVERLRNLSRTGTGRWRGGLHEKIASRLERKQFQFRDLFGNHNSVKLTAFKAFAEEYGVADEYRWWWDSGIFWDEVVSIESVGEQKIYDLTVESTSCFIANDIVVHNTWVVVVSAIHAWKEHKKKVLVVSPEIGRVELGERLIAKYGSFSYGDMVAATLGTFVESKLRAVVEELKLTEGFFILDDPKRLNPDGIERTIDAVQPDIVFIDSVYMLKVATGQVKKGAGSKGSVYDRIIDTMDWLRELSIRKDLPVVGISQLSRDGKVTKAQADQMKKGFGTGGLENAVAMTDQLFWHVHNLFALFQDKDMALDKIMAMVPLKARRQGKEKKMIVTRFDMQTMDFSQIGTKVETTSNADDFSDDDDVAF